MTNTSLVKKKVPLREGLFKIPENHNLDPYLIASRCQSCGEHFVPLRMICLNCGKEEMEEVALSGKGKVSTYTIVMQQVPGSLVPAPYGLAIIAMDEGCQVHTIVTEKYESLKVGMPVKVYFEKIKEDSEGNEQLVYKFKPSNS
jgi:uncharacterized OB-fold protein